MTLHFGVLSYSFKEESEYTEKSKKLAEEILQLEDYEIEDLFFGNFRSRDQLESTFASMGVRSWINLSIRSGQ